MNVIIWMLLAMGLTAIMVPSSLPFLRKLKFGQFVRDDGPQSHLAKTGTPTMGGLIFLPVIALLTIIAGLEAPQLFVPLAVGLGFGVIGFIDDYIKVIKKRSLGFRAYQKMAAQLLITVCLIAYYMTTTEQASEILVPFTGGYFLDIGWLLIPFLLFFILGTVNGVNLTDGIDGLSTSVTISVMGFFLVVDQTIGFGLSPLFAIIIGALFGFLIYNSHPAALFMGDTGSLALGGFVASVAVLMQMPLFIVLVGFIYLAEVISVILQVGYYKRTKKRLFKMAPIHHHFELLGWKETKVVYIFTILTVALCLIAYLGLGMS